jgi:outer membrane protein assembly factor BamB
MGQSRMNENLRRKGKEPAGAPALTGGAPVLPSSRMRALFSLVSVLLLVVLFSGRLVRAADAPLGGAEVRPSVARPVGWRGDGSGHFPSASPVAKWSAKENVLWQTEVGAGQSSPIVVGQRVLLTSEPDLLICLDTETGKELWRRSHPFSGLPAEAAAKGPKHSSQYGDATPTPVSDGKWVWMVLGTGIVACHDLEGNGRWTNWYEARQNTQYGRTASPVLVGDRLLVHLGPLVCLEAATGRLLWQNESAKATYGTPAPARLGGVDVVVAPKGQVVRVADGKILAADLGNCMYTSPVVEGRTAYFIDGAMSAVQLPEKAADEIECKEVWSRDLTGDFFASPLVQGGRVYTVDKAANYYVIDAQTGQTLLKKKLEWAMGARAEGASVYPSLCLAGKQLVAGNDAGEALLLAPGDQGAVVGTGSLPGGSGGTPVFSGRRMFARGGKFLYCIGE